MLIVRSELIESLEPHGRNPRRDRIEEGYEKSFEWLWALEKSGPGFVNWLQGDEPLFWIAGKPGSGKSTLMKQAFYDARTLNYLSSNKDQPVRIACFFFHELGSDEEQNLLGFLHGILAQLLKSFKELAPCVIPIFKRLKHSSRPVNQRSIWTQHELMHTLKHIFKEANQTGCICLFIDGLDECAGSHRDQLDFLLPWIRNANRSRVSLKVCLASRPLVEIEHRLSRYPGFKIHEWTITDIAAFTIGKLRETTMMLSCSDDTQVIRKDVQQGLIDNILDKASGVFLWVKLVVQEIVIGLEDGDTDRELQERLDHLPPELEDLYQRIIVQISPQYWKDAFNYFQLLIHSRRPSLELI